MITLNKVNFMNNKKARMLRKQAGGNTAEFINGAKHRSLTRSSSRRKYKDLKVLYRLIGI